jgi:hypothetical protein
VVITYNVQSEQKDQCNVNFRMERPWKGEGIGVNRKLEGLRSLENLDLKCQRCVGCKAGIAKSAKISNPRLIHLK